MTPRRDYSDLAERIRQLEQQGVRTRQQQANELDVPLSTLMRQLGKISMTSSGDEWIPWKVRREHTDDPIYKQLRWLAQAARERETRDRYHRRAAVRWARDLVAKNLDVTYDREAGFRTVPAIPHDWYLDRLLTAAVRFIISRPELDDLGKDVS